MEVLFSWLDFPFFLILNNLLVHYAKTQRAKAAGSQGFEEAHQSSQLYIFSAECRD